MSSKAKVYTIKSVVAALAVLSIGLAINGSRNQKKVDVEKILNGNIELKDLVSTFVKVDRNIMKPEVEMRASYHPELDGNITGSGTGNGYVSLPVETGRKIAELQMRIYVPKEVGALLDQNVFEFSNFDSLAFIMGKINVDGELFRYVTFNPRDNKNPTNTVVVTKDNFEKEKKNICDFAKGAEINHDKNFEAGREVIRFIEKKYTRLALWQKPSVEVQAGDAKSVVEKKIAK